jgi:hypothetical protein
LLYIVDLLHEFELGIWRNTFLHLLRILYAYGGEAIQTLNERSDHRFLLFHSNSDAGWQVSSSASIWQEHHTSVSKQCLGNEETRCEGFRGFITGT